MGPPIGNREESSIKKNNEYKEYFCSPREQKVKPNKAKSNAKPNSPKKIDKFFKLNFSCTVVFNSHKISFCYFRMRVSQRLFSNMFPVLKCKGHCRLG